MSLIEVNWHPDNKELRRFGPIALIATIVISLLLHWLKGLDWQWCFVIIGLGFIIFLASLISLKLTRIIYLTLILVTLPIGFVVAESYNHCYSAKFS